MRKQQRKVLALVALFAVMFLLATLLRTRVNPLTEQLALAKISDVASKVINEAVSEQIAAGNIQYDDLVQLQTDASGNITALTTNMQTMNRLKTQILTMLDSDIYKVGDDEISIPAGNLTGMQLLSGRGPKIPVKIVAVSASDANFVGEFSEAGINQTIHRIMLNVALDLIVLLPSGAVTNRVSTDVCVAETVLLGPVPENYTYFNSVGGTAAEQYFASE